MQSKDLPADLDIVRVVRCKNCEFYHDFEYYYDCRHSYGLDLAHPDDYCSYGKLKSNKQPETQIKVSVII